MFQFNCTVCGVRFHFKNDIFNEYIPIHLLSFLLVLLDFSLTVKAATLIFISGRGSAISSAKQGKSGSIYNLVKN